MTTADGIRPTVQDAVEGIGLVLEDVAVTPAGRRRVVKVLVDRDPGPQDVADEPTDPLTLDEVADATRAVSDALDASDLMGEQPYTLEVSSPGVEHPLHRIRAVVQQALVGEGVALRVCLGEDHRSKAGQQRDQDQADGRAESAGRRSFDSSIHGLCFRGCMGCVNSGL